MDRGPGEGGTRWKQHVEEGVGMEGGATWRNCFLFSLFQTDNSTLDHLAFYPGCSFHCWSFCQKRLGLQRVLTYRAGTDLTVRAGSSSQQGGATHTVPTGVQAG